MALWRSLTLLPLLLATTAPVTTAATLTVTSLDDDGPGTLRGALAFAGDGDVIEFAVSGTILLTSGPLIVPVDVRFHGPGAEILSLSGGDANAVLEIDPGATVVIRDLTVRNGAAYTGAIQNRGVLLLQRVTLRDNGTWPISRVGGILNLGRLRLEDSAVLDNGSPDGEVGAIYSSGPRLEAFRTVFARNAAYHGRGAIILERGTMLLQGCTFERNLEAMRIDSEAIAEIEASTFLENGSEWGGAAIANNGRLYVTNSTVSANQNYYEGTAIHNTGHITATHCTIALNTGDACAGGGVTNTGRFIARNTIIAGNTKDPRYCDPPADFFGTLQSEGHNLIGDTAHATIVVDAAIAGSDPGDLLGVDPMLQPLADNGGLTLTHAAVGPGVDAGGFVRGVPFDQRGRPRAFDGDGDGVAVPDIGAFELQCSLNGGGSGPPCPQAGALRQRLGPRRGMAGKARTKAD